MRGERNVFDDLGFSREESAELSQKANLCSQIVRYARQYSQAELAEILEESQPRVSDLMRGKIAKFSLGKLVEYAEALHMNPEIKVHRPVVMMAAH
ncbi:MAG: helix-turn-helix transcriptional regulator [Candidatus Acidiferrales bacterium]